MFVKLTAATAVPARQGQRPVKPSTTDAAPGAATARSSTASATPSSTPGAGQPTGTASSQAVAVVTGYLVTMSLLAVVATIWAFNIADRVTAKHPKVTVAWIGPDFDADLLTSNLLLAAVAGVVGSLVYAGNLFTRRVGWRSFESSFVPWYLMRPLLSAMLAMVTVATVRGGIFTLGPTGADGATPTLSFAIGALAGLFLDTVLIKLRAILGATAVDKAASTQDPPDGTAKKATTQKPVVGA